MKVSHIGESPKRALVMVSHIWESPKRALVMVSHTGEGSKFDFLTKNSIFIGVNIEIV